MGRYVADIHSAGTPHLTKNEPIPSASCKYYGNKTFQCVMLKGLKTFILAIWEFLDETFLLTDKDTLLKPKNLCEREFNVFPNIFFSQTFSNILLS